MRALVIGGARSGMGVSLLLNKEGYDVTLVSRDPFDTIELLESKGIKVVLDDKETDKYDDFELIVKNPGIPNTHPLVKRFKHVYNEIEIASRFNPKGQYYAISGTNGKTTTTHLLHAMLMKKDNHALLAGNIGIPLSQKIYEEGDLKRDVALEIAAFQIEGTEKFSPVVYALLNLTPDHLDRFENADAYYNAKLKLVESSQTFIRNIDDANIVRLTKNVKTDVLNLSLKEKADIYIDQNTAYFKDQFLFDINDLKLKAEHNMSNALFAASMAYLAGVSVMDIQSVLKEFTGIEHRLEYVDTIKGVAYYNDSKGTNPESTEKALTSFDQPILLLAGGYDENIEFDVLSKYASKCKEVYLFGQSKSKLKEIFKDAHLVEDMASAFKLASEAATEGDVVLLSPACASYDQFKNFEERGTIFKSYVKNIKLD